MLSSTARFGHEQSFGYQSLNVICFEKIDQSGTGKVDLRHSAAVVLFVTGSLLFFVAWGTALSAVGFGLIVMGYIGLVLTAAKFRYFRYFWLDDYGIHHIEGDTPQDRTAHFAWHEVATVETSYDEFTGLILTLSRTGMRGVPIYLSTAHAKEAAGVIRARIEAQSANCLPEQLGNPSAEPGPL